MKCTRCQREIGRKEPLTAHYVRSSDGKKFSFIFCEQCSIDYSKWLTAIKDAAEENKEKISEGT